MTPPTTPPHISVPGYSGPERRTAERIWRDNVDQRFSQGAETMQELRADVDAAKKSIESVKQDTQDLVEFFESVRGAFRVLNWIGSLAKPIGAIAAAAGATVALYINLKGGGHK